MISGELRDAVRSQVISHGARSENLLSSQSLRLERWNMKAAARGCVASSGDQTQADRNTLFNFRTPLPK